MPQYAFILGTYPELCQAELTSVVNRLISKCTLNVVQPRLVIGTSMFLTKDKIHEIMEELGGTIKIGELLEDISDLGIKNVITILKSYIDPSLPFGITNLSKRFLNDREALFGIKDSFKRENQGSRYIYSQDQKEISAVLLKKQKLQEFILFDDKDSLHLVKTIAYQDVDAWSKRDFERPQADAYSGMLPPKISRILVNLALPDKKNPLVLDPFCGMGTILAESMMLGCDVIGSDVLESVIPKVRENLEWLQKNFIEARNRKFQLVHSDAVHIAKNISQKIDAIVTEPYLGTPYRYNNSELYIGTKKATIKSVQNNLKGLEKLYTGSLKEWSRLLIEKAKVVMVLPEVHIGNQVFSVKNVVDRCEKLGYTLSQGSFYYARPNAILHRQIVVFQKI